MTDERQVTNSAVDPQPGGSVQTPDAPPPTASSGPAELPMGPGTLFDYLAAARRRASQEPGVPASRPPEPVDLGRRDDEAESAPPAVATSRTELDLSAEPLPPSARSEFEAIDDSEAVEAVSEIIGRVATGGTTVEPAFDLVDEGLGARVDPTRPAVVRGYVPAGDASAADRAHAAAAEVAEALGHLQAFGLRPIGELRVRTVREADWADAWKAYFPVMRIGRRLVIRPTWHRHRAAADDVVLALDPGMAFGTGLHPTTRLCLAALEPLADDGRLLGARVLDVGCGSGILAIAAMRRPSLEGLAVARRVLGVFRPSRKLSLTAPSVAVTTRSTTPSAGLS